MRPRLQWWAEEAERLAARLDRWLTACQELGQGLGQGYTKLHCDERPPVAAPTTPPTTRNPLKTCAQRLQNIARITRTTGPTSSTPASHGKQPTRLRHPRAPRQPHSKPDQVPGPACSAQSTSIVFEKCRPRHSDATRSEAKAEVRAGVRAASPSVPAVDIVYYPFRVENCVVCRQMSASPRPSAITAVPCPRPCPRDGCCAPYVPTPQQQATGATGALLFRRAAPTDTPPLPRLTPSPPRLPPPPPRPQCGEREPVISMNQDYIEVRYDRPPPTPPSTSPECPPPSYQAAMRRSSVFDRDPEEHDANPSMNLALFSPRHSKTSVKSPPHYDDPEEDTIYSRNSVDTVLERELEFVPRLPQPRPNHRLPAHYRSRGKFSSVMYETQRMFEEAFHVTSQEVAPWSSGGGARGSARGSAHGPTRAWSLHGPAERMGLREVDLPHGGGLGHGSGQSSGLGLRSLLSIRRRPGGVTGGGGGGGAGGRSSQGACCPTPAARCSGRPQKRVVVGERGLRGPLWPRVILTFDRGVSPCQGPYQGSY